MDDAEAAVFFGEGVSTNSARRRAKCPDASRGCGLRAYKRFLLSRTRTVCLEPTVGTSSCSSKLTLTLPRTEPMSALPA